MEATGLMLGNIIARCDNHEQDVVVAIENCMVHLAKRKLPDDERYIEGVPLTEWINRQTNGSKKGKVMIIIKGISLEFTVKRSHMKAILLFSLHQHLPDIILTYLHHLQNLVFILTGQQLDTDKKWEPANP